MGGRGSPDVAQHGEVSLAANLPLDVLMVIFSFLPVQDVVKNCSLLNKHWREASCSYKLPLVTLRQKYAENSEELVQAQRAWPRLVQVGFESTITRISEKYV